MTVNFFRETNALTLSHISSLRVASIQTTQCLDLLFQSLLKERFRAMLRVKLMIPGYISLKSKYKHNFDLNKQAAGHAVLKLDKETRFFLLQLRLKAHRICLITTFSTCYFNSTLSVYRIQ